MADNDFATLISKDGNLNSISNPIFTRMTDGTDAIAINADGSLNVTINNASIAVTATDLDIRDLSHSQDSIKIGDGTDFLAVNADGSINVVTTLTNDTIADDAAFTVGTSKVYPMGALADETSPDSVDEGDIGAPRMTLDRKLLVRVVGATDANRLDIDASGRPTVNVNGTVTVTATDLDIRDLTHVSDSVKIGDGTDFLAIDASGNIGVTDAGGSLTVDGTVTIQDGGNVITVDATDLDIRDLTLAADAIKISGNSTANSATNPIFVQEVNAVVTGEVNSYSTATVAGAGTSNHDYTVTTTMKLSSIIVSSSGALKGELQVGPVASLVSKAVVFIPKQGGSQQIFFDPAIEVPSTSTGTVRIIRTNRESSSNDVYSTIIGIDN